ncbi:hypothetical protein BKA67DRAFT_537771 [Truncatella angustata]|uniref:Uncharacterized protein n=1 Tax=Truncatella angustata TaxID=152316 RepID=A0A9P8ZWG0_9PEZI|nr:uncharacterized protein BKA67DRAFT_537771 [Truncatella angustata]KAH6651918.1 hypothetical protein BKA67DRAFT_537771 [Truncatella angustata]
MLVIAIVVVLRGRSLGFLIFLVTWPKHHGAPIYGVEGIPSVPHQHLSKQLGLRGFGLADLLVFLVMHFVRSTGHIYTLLMGQEPPCLGIVLTSSQGLRASPRDVHPDDGRRRFRPGFWFVRHGQIRPRPWSGDVVLVVLLALPRAVILQLYRLLTLAPARIAPARSIVSGVDLGCFAAYQPGLLDVGLLRLPAHLNHRVSLPGQGVGLPRPNPTAVLQAVLAYLVVPVVLAHCGWMWADGYDAKTAVEVL